MDNYNNLEEKPLTTSSRLNALRNYQDNEVLLKQAAEADLKNKTDHLILQIQKLEPRIKDLITTGNACLQSNIPLTGQAFGMRENYDTNQFITNSWSHLVGFVCNPRDQSSSITFLGINGGGACGKYDFRTDGVRVFSVNEHDPSDVITPPTGVMERFLNRFNEFESSFYNYVDHVIEKQQKSVDKMIATAQNKASQQNFSQDHIIQSPNR